MSHLGIRLLVHQAPDSLGVPELPACTAEIGGEALGGERKRVRGGEDFLGRKKALPVAR
jgi:hypothetical protein